MWGWPQQQRVPRCAHTRSLQQSPAPWLSCQAQKLCPGLTTVLEQSAVFGRGSWGCAWALLVSPPSTDLQYHPHIRAFSLCSSHLLSWHWNSSLMNLGKSPQKPQMHYPLFSPRPHPSTNWSEIACFVLFNKINKDSANCCTWAFLLFYLDILQNIGLDVC